MLAEALVIYRRHFGALILTCALSLIPANLLMVGAVVFGLASMGAGGVAEARTHTQQLQDKQRELQDDPPQTPEDRETRVRQLGREALEGKAAFDADFLRLALPIAYAVLMAMAVLLAGLSLAHSAVTPLVADLAAGVPTGPARAWAAVAQRLGALAWTAVIGVPLVALGSLLCLVPGIVLAIGFGFAIPVTMSEGISGRAALERSWALSRGHWAPILGIWVLIAVFTVLASGLSVLAPQGPWRAVISGLVRLATYPFPLVALVLLYHHARRQEGQYMRRISAPG